MSAPELVAKERGWLCDYISALEKRVILFGESVLDECVAEANTAAGANRSKRALLTPGLKALDYLAGGTPTDD